MNKVQKIGNHHFRLGTVCHGGCQRGQSPGCITFQPGTEDCDGILPSRTAEHVGDAVRAELVSCHCCCLIEKRQRITDRTFGRTGDGSDRLGLGVDVLTLADSRQMAGKLVSRHPPQIKSLASRQDGDRNLANLGGGEDELHIVGRLLKCLQQRVEGALRHHVDLVDDIDLEAGRDRAVPDPFDDLARVVYAGVACRVNFQNIHMPPGTDGLARLAGSTRLQRGFTVSILANTVQAARQQARCRGLAHPADTSQDKGVGEATERKGIA